MSSAVLVSVAVSSGYVVCWSVVPLVFGCSSQETDLWDEGTVSLMPVNIQWLTLVPS